METLRTIQPELLTLTRDQASVLMPYLVLFGGIVVAMIASVMKMISPKWPVFLITVGVAIAGVASCIDLMPHETITLFNGMMTSDRFSLFFDVIFLASMGLTTLASFRYLDREKMQHPEYYLLLMFSALGMMLMASALDLIVVFIALELMSLSVYVLVGFRRADRRSNEAAMKYFILGSAASAIMLYGAALLYGSTGSLNIHEILKFVQSNHGTSMVFVLGAWLLILGFLFKIASVPFHMWMPDVYEGAPTPVTGFMTTGLKAAAFATFVRIFISMGYGKGLSAVIESHIHDIIWICAVLTMTLGNLVALTQTNLKRMLAYSSIAHTGYILVGLLAGAQSEQGYAPVVMYLVAYSIMNLGAFVILSVLGSRDDSGLNLQDMAGLSRRHPWIAFAMAIFLFSMAGIPPTAGFAAKYLLFYSAIQAHEVWLVVIAVLCSAVSVYYYFRVLVYMYMRDPVGSPSGSRVSVWATLSVAAMVAMTLQIGVLPEQMVQAARRAITGL
jgi:NADH-quinone oxidoreductase subunit N